MSYHELPSDAFRGLVLPARSAPMKRIPHVLHHDHLILRPWQREDASWYVHARDDEVFAWTTESPELTVHDTERAIQAIAVRDDAFSFAMVDADTRALLGNIALARDATRVDRWEVMYWLAPHGRGRGIATTAVRLITDWAFAHVAATQITLRTHAANVRSQRVAERAGFRRTDAPSVEVTPSVSVWYIRTNERTTPPIPCQP